MPSRVDTYALRALSFVQHNTELHVHPAHRNRLHNMRFW
jgi:hypothetical protein